MAGMSQMAGEGKAIVRFEPEACGTELLGCRVSEDPGDEGRDREGVHPLSDVVEAPVGPGAGRCHPASSVTAATATPMPIHWRGATRSRSTSRPARTVTTG